MSDAGIPTNDDDWPTELIPALPDTGRRFQSIQGPSATRQFIHSMQYYVMVMSVVPVMFWVVLSIQYHLILLGAAITTTAIAAGLCLLRRLRGSVLQDEADIVEQSGLQPNPIGVSNRIGRRLEVNEIVIWETRLHPLKLISTWRKDLVSSSGGLIMGGYITLLLVLILMDSRDGFSVVWWMYALMGTVPAAYLIYTVVEWRNELYAITNLRFMAVKGVFRTETPSMPREKITDFRAVTPMWAHFLTWARITKRPFAIWRVETAGQWQGLDEVRYIPDGDANATLYPPMLR